MIVITVARKPLDGTVARNVLTWGAGGINIDATRIRHTEDFSGVQGFASMKLNAQRAGESHEDWVARVKGGPEQQASLAKLQKLGRWPSNLILSHLKNCRQVGTRELPPYMIQQWQDGAKPFGGGKGHAYTSVDTGPQLVDVWECEDGCPSAGLDAQSGDRRSTLTGRADPKAQHAHPSTASSKERVALSGGLAKPGTTVYADAGGASRFFKQVKSDPRNG